jgi:hypothetical protein
MELVHLPEQNPLVIELSTAKYYNYRFAIFAFFTLKHSKPLYSYFTVNYPKEKALQEAQTCRARTG